MGSGLKSYMDIATFALALLGAVLGVLNAWRNWAHDRLHLRVEVAPAKGFDGTDAITISVRNLSRFDVTLTAFGLHCVGRKEHMQLWEPMFTGDETLPVRLASRTSCTVFQAVAALPPERWLVVESAYVSTACGNQAEGGRALFSEHRTTFAEQAAKGASQAVAERVPFKTYTL